MSGFLKVTGVVPGMDWPAVPNPRGAQLLALQMQLEQSQWLPAEEIAQLQREQRHLIAVHASRHVPFYQQLWSAQVIEPEESLSDEEWQLLPVVSRGAIQQFPGGVTPRVRLPRHGPTYQGFTSGSTGRPLQTAGNTVTQLMWSALSLRNHLWHRHDFSGKMLGIRAGSGDTPQPLQRHDNWGLGTNDLIRTGPGVTLDVRTPINELAAILREENPDYLNTYPSVVAELARHALSQDWKLPRLREVRTFGEILEESTRSICRRAWQTTISDCYSSQEAGYIALQCPQHEHYHVQSESILVEILNDQGLLCAPGQIGRVVLTTLLNFDFPLIRYDTGDFAEAGASCDCGRGLPVLKRIVGRQRNMAILPNGDRLWPSLDLDAQGLDYMPPVLQFQMIQRSLERVELRIVPGRPFSVEDEAMVRHWVQQALTYPFEVQIAYLDEIPRGAGGKYEDFRCEVTLPDEPTEVSLQDPCLSNYVAR
jgi:phenylacetate-CoA ligase